MDHRFLKVWGRCGAAALVVIGAACAHPAAAHADGAGLQRVPLAGAAPARATPAAELPDVRRLTVHVVLPLRRTRQLHRVARAVSDPRNPRYGRHLSRAQVMRRFAPTPAAVRAITTWARRAGLRVSRVSPSGRVITLTAPARRLEAAFHTRLHAHEVAGELLHEPSVPPRVPADIARHIGYVAGLAPEPRLEPAATPMPAPVQPGPCSRWWGELTAHTAPTAYDHRPPWVICGYTPQQLRSAYGVNGVISQGLNGLDQSVGIVGVGSSPTVQQDVNQHAARHRLPPVDLEVRSAPSGEAIYGNAAAQAWQAEQALDIEAVHALAPRARIVYQAATTSFRTSLMNAIEELVMSGEVQIISLSFAQNGERDDLDDPVGRYELDEQLFAMAAAAGIGIYGASGDHGDNLHNPSWPERQVSWPAISPYVTGVGGTSLAIDGSGARAFEIPWGNARSRLSGGTWSPAPPGEYVSGGGGGTSQIQGQPDYQRAVVPEQIAYYYRDHDPIYSSPAIPGRAVPDVAAVGDPGTGFVTGMTMRHADGTDRYGEYRQGGTSLATPLFAALMALADQAAGRRHGAANRALYALAGSTAFHDVAAPSHPVAVVRNDGVTGGQVETSLASMAQLGTLSATSGYDDTTGLGTPNGVPFLRALAPGWKPGHLPRPNGG